MSQEREGPVVEELVRDALDGWEHLLPPDVLEHFGHALADALTAHPDGQRLVRPLIADPVVQQSGDVAQEPGASSDAATEQPARGNTRRR